ENGNAVSTEHAPGCIAVTGFSSDEFASNPNLWLSMVAPEDRPLVEKNARLLASGTETGSFEHRIYRKDGKMRWVRNTPVLHYAQNGKLESYDGLIQDITERRIIEDALRKSELKYRGLVENMHDIVWGMDVNYVFTYISPTIGQYGFTPEEVIGRPLWDFTTPGTSESLKLILTANQRDIKVGNTENISFVTEQYHKDGSISWMEVSSNPIFDEEGKLVGYQGISRDITERKAIEEALAKALSEKEALLGELNHRVKNSLAMIAGLVGLEINQAKVPSTIKTLENMHRRITTISNLYDILVAKEEDTNLRLDVYLQRIIETLSSSYVSDPSRIVILTHFDPITIDMKRAAIVGLILNELLTNALKYAFPERSGQVKVDLSLNVEKIELTVSDNGVGLPVDFDMSQSTGLGSKLVLMLASQLRGSVRAERDDRTSFTVTIPE
ncbi:MAG TPA: PAS domain S-box protein, partial [Spirochaetota bacterium]